MYVGCASGGGMCVRVFVSVYVDVTDALTSYQMANSHVIFDTKDGIPTIIVIVVMSFSWGKKKKRNSFLKS